ncbi:hypothetical protein scyTo_0006744 [Scyliorhinus torazame]|uniref:Uncharacterized protein n=1 Tax=Scyliorhinus torazame TaxID=75743 RepID=A0A401PJT4_SCYTO|nr:hypothetical protein [Scyliorhinus torazame]
MWGNSSNCEAASFQPAGLMEKIQAIAQNVSNLTTKMEQLLQMSLTARRDVAFYEKAKGKEVSQCEVPKDPKFPDCLGKIEVSSQYSSLFRVFLNVAYEV